MSACLPAGTGAARLMLFVGGPPTCGPGKVVETDLQEPIRSHKVRLAWSVGCTAPGLPRSTCCTGKPAAAHPATVQRHGRWRALFCSAALPRSAARRAETC